MKHARAAYSLVAVLFASGCSGGGGAIGNPAPVGPTSPGGGGGSQSQSDTAIAITNSFGTPLKTLASYDSSVSSPAALSGYAHRSSLTLGSCTNGVEFFAPDKNGDPNSTELDYFYDAACTQLARDAVRIYTSTGPSSETVARTVNLYAIGNATAIATRSDTETITNATFDPYGYPVVSTGFDRTDASALNISGSRTIVSDNEIVMLPGTGSNAYCGDSAGYNATGIAKLGQTFGWQGTTASGTRTVNGNGSVTWSATEAGSTSKGAIGSLSVVTGSQNSNCPIATPMFALAGGTSVGTYSIPVSATYVYGMLVNLTIAGATLSNGNTLTVTTNTNVLPTNSSFILGTISNGGTQIATFALDGFGDGILTVTSSGAQYVVTDWHVVR